MSTETEQNQKMHQAMAAAIAKHPKKTMAAGGFLVIAGLVIQFASPLCGLIPNPVAKMLCSNGAQVVGEAVNEVAKDAQEGPQLGLGNEEDAGQ